MIRSTVFIISMVLASVLALPGLPVPAQDRIPATVTSVVDGDTIRVQSDGGSLTLSLAPR
jgi:endonuclease YncB( thermonuclease family)